MNYTNRSYLILEFFYVLNFSIQCSDCDSTLILVKNSVTFVFYINGITNCYRSKLYSCYMNSEYWRLILPDYSVLFQSLQRFVIFMPDSRFWINVGKDASNKKEKVFVDSVTQHLKRLLPCAWFYVTKYHIFTNPHPFPIIFFKCYWSFYNKVGSKVKRSYLVL